MADVLSGRAKSIGLGVAAIALLATMLTTPWAQYPGYEAAGALTANAGASALIGGLAYALIRGVGGFYRRIRDVSVQD